MQEQSEGKFPILHAPELFVEASHSSENVFADHHCAWRDTRA
jgi:hypothetical protein